MEAVGARKIKVEIEKGDKETTVEITRDMPAEVPMMLKKFVHPWNRMTQVEIWKGDKGGPYTCEVKVEFVGAPIAIEGTMSLKGNKSDGCTAKTNSKVSCGIPLVGRKLAKFVGEASEEALGEEFTYIGKNA